MGTSVVSGEANMVVCATGNKAYLGIIVAHLKPQFWIRSEYLQELEGSFS